jgi:hypothetical protein
MPDVITFERALLVLNTLILVSGGSIWAVVEGYRAFHQKPYDYKGNLSVTELKRFDDGSRLYDVSFDIEVKNSSKSQIAISYSFAELYIGDAKDDGLKVGEAVVINDTPDPWHPGPTGLITWTRKAYEADIADGNTNRKVLDFLHQHFATIGNGGLTTVLPGGTSDEYEPEFLVRASPNQYAAVVIGFGVDDSIDIHGPDVAILNETRPFATAEKEDSPKRVRDRSGKK